MKFSRPGLIASISLVSFVATGCVTSDDAGTGNDTDNPSTGASGDDDGNTDPTVSSIDDTGTGTADDTGTGTADDTGTGTAGATASVRVIHASPGAGNVDVYIAGETTPLAADLAYGSATTYTEIAAGDVVLEVRPAGAAAEDPALYTSEAITLADGGSLSAVAVGLAGSKDDADSLRILPLADNWGTPEAGTALVRVVHAGADAPTVDLDIGLDGTPDLEGLARFSDSGEAGVPLPATVASRIGVVAGGNVLTSFSAPPLPDGATILVIATGLAADLPREPTALGLLAVLTDAALPIIPQDPRLYALHAGGLGLDADVCIDGAVAIGGLTLTEATAMGRIQLAPGNYGFTVDNVANKCATKVRNPFFTGPLAAGQQYLLVLGRDEAGELAPSVLTEEFDLAGDAAQGQVTLAHAAELEEVLVGIVEGAQISGMVLRGGLDPGDESAIAPFAAGEYLVGVSTDTAPPSPALAAGTLTIAGGERQWVVLSGDGTSINEGNPLDLRYRIIETNAHPAPWTVGTDIVLDVP